MEKIKTLEKKIVHYTRQAEPSNEAKAFNAMLTFWETYDKTFNTNHSEIIRTIYVYTNIFDQSEVSLSMKLHMSESTLLRYRKKYIRSFNVCFERLGDKD